MLCARVLPGMRARRRGFVVNICSEAGVFVYPGMGEYAVSKHALRVLTALLQEENQSHGIKAWAVCPGMVDTPMSDVHPVTTRERFLTVEESRTSSRGCCYSGTTSSSAHRSSSGRCRTPGTRSAPARHQPTPRRRRLVEGLALVGAVRRGGPVRGTRARRADTCQHAPQDGGPEQGGRRREQLLNA